MAIKVNLTAINNALRTVETNVETMSMLLSSIDTDYIQATNNEWNTPNAAKYVDSLVQQLNDFASQFNTKVSEALSNFVSGVNALNQQEGAGNVANPSLKTLSSIQRGWAAQETEYNTTNTYGEFTATNFTPKMEKISNVMSNCREAVKTARSAGLDDAFCNQLVNGFTSLVDSASEVIKTYNGKAAQNAQTKDTNVRSIQANT